MIQNTNAIEPNEDGNFDFKIHNFQYILEFTDKIYSTKSPTGLHKKILVESERQNSIKEIPHNDKLAGDIKKETMFLLSECSEELKNEIINFVGKQIQQVSNIFSESKKIKSIHFDTLWVNYQKSGEYNPFHNHDGDFSFVWYLDVPEVVRKEHIIATTDTKLKPRGLIQFYSRKTDEQLVFNPKSGDFLLFDSKQPHAVYPFYTKDVTRISMSGNIDITYEEE